MALASGPKWEQGKSTGDDEKKSDENNDHDDDDDDEDEHDFDRVFAQVDNDDGGGSGGGDEGEGEEDDLMARFRRGGGELDLSKMGSSVLNVDGTEKEGKIGLLKNIRSIYGMQEC